MKPARSFARPERFLYRTSTMPPQHRSNPTPTPTKMINAAEACDSDVAPTFESSCAPDIDTVPVATEPASSARPRFARAPSSSCENVPAEPLIAPAACVTCDAVA